MAPNVGQWSPLNDKGEPEQKGKGWIMPTIWNYWKQSEEGNEESQQSW